tara:strand:+ start:139 stop:348 length:210 start_codon:yes stop_codon:yes gene_type:complete
VFLGENEMPQKFELTIHEQVVIEMALMHRVDEMRELVTCKIAGSHFARRVEDCKSVYQKISGRPMPDPE